MFRNFNNAEVDEISDNPDLIKEDNLNSDFMVTNLKNEVYDLPSINGESVLSIEGIYVKEASVYLFKLLL